MRELKKRIYKGYEIIVVKRVFSDGSYYYGAFVEGIEVIGCGDTPEEAIEEAIKNLDFYLEYKEEEK